MGEVVEDYLGNNTTHLYRLAARWGGSMSRKRRRKQRSGMEQNGNTTAR